MKAQSFTSVVKEELVSIPYFNERLRSLLSAFTRINGSLIFQNKSSVLSLKTENAKIAKFIFSSFSSLYGINPKLLFLKKSNFKLKTIYQLFIDNEVEDILSDLEIDFLEGKIPKNLVFNDELISAYLVGAFLSSGSVNSPLSSTYHLEISINEENYAKWFKKLFSKYRGGSFDVKEIKRRDRYVIYLKKADQIVDFLILLGATDAALKFEEIRLSRDFASVGNRLQNVDKANLDKVLSTSKRQLDDIALLEEKIGIDNLKNEKLKALIKLRLENEDDSFNELAKKMSIKFEQNISKSNINHLFRELREKVAPYKEKKK